MAKVKVQKSDDGSFAPGHVTTVEQSVRYAADPLTRLFDQSRLSINGTTVANCPTNLQDISTIQLRLEGTKASGAACGSAGLLSMDQRMHYPDVDPRGPGNETYTSVRFSVSKTDTCCECQVFQCQSRRSVVTVS